MAVNPKLVKKVPLKKEKVEKVRSYLSQKDVPAVTLNQALRLAKTIVDNYGSKPVSPLQAAIGLDLSLSSSTFKMLCGASIAYNLTSGGYNAGKIELLPLALRILKPKKENDDYIAKVEAFRSPKIIKDFLDKYDGSPIPKNEIAKNILEDMGVPSDKLDYVFNIIIEEGERLSLIRILKDRKYVQIPKSFEDVPSDIDGEADEIDHHNDIAEIDNREKLLENLNGHKKYNEDIENPRLKRVFVTHGKNRTFIDLIKKLLKFGELEAVVSVEKTSVSVPVPEKVMNDMRSCGAAIIHVEEELELMDKSANEHKILNPNVLIEIGAAIALYGKRFILLVKEGTTLPSNLQGLFEVRYEGDILDGDTTMKLLDSINDIKNQKLPEA